MTTMATNVTVDECLHCWLVLVNDRVAGYFDERADAEMSAMIWRMVTPDTLVEVEKLEIPF